MTTLIVISIFWMFLCLPFGFIYYLMVAIESPVGLLIVYLIHSIIAIAIVIH